MNLFSSQWGSRLFLLLLTCFAGCSVLAQTSVSSSRRTETPPPVQEGPPPEGPGGGGFDGPPPSFNGGGDGPRGPRGGFGMVQQEIKLVDRFDKDGDKRLNATERKAAREDLAQQGTGRRFGRRGGFGPGGWGQETASPKPGPKLTPAEVKTFPDAPLYDAKTLRTFFLQFEESDWEKELAEFKGTDVEVPAKLTVDGKTYQEVGVHFRGMSSFMMVGEGQKRSLGLSLDYAHKDQQLGGYRNLHLLNAHEDPSFLRSVLSYQIDREYVPAPKANFVRVVINGESWGVYVNVQHYNKDFVHDWFETTKGARWKVPGSPAGQGSLAYLGDDAAAYQRIYEIKSKHDPKAWADLAHLCKVLNETPADQLEKALAPLLDIDGALKFLALENVLVNNDGYWIRSSDYNLYQDVHGRFHVLPEDSNETFSRAGGPGFGGGPRGGGRFGGPGGGRGFRGGPGGFGSGPGMFLAQPILSQGDKNGDQKISKEEFTALADRWFDKLDSDQVGQVNQEQFAARLTEVLPRPEGFEPPREQMPAGPGRGGFGPAMFLGPSLFTAADANKDGSLTRSEWKEAFAKWHGQWDSDNSGWLNEEKLRAGLNSTLSQPGFGNRGAGGGRGGMWTGGRGPRGPGFAGGNPGQGGQLDPLISANDATKPLASKLLAVPALRARYLTYVRDIADKWLDWNQLGPIAQEYHSLIAADVKADTRKLESTEEFENSLTGDQAGTGFGGRSVALKTFADERRAYLLSYPEIKKLVVGETGPGPK